ncbi:hypothetical protein UFOVP111_75 [uncultured Caudovirales phage]|uniref:Uncharacterized protein n=1 Tax=uncultured Caudovirales phage TaxID=2100421 RepID=A0A6J5L5B6_9CAUD|nr:hypothetical protein UFOVP111_75 [uncultured Caudovirales phage]
MASKPQTTRDKVLRGKKQAAEVIKLQSVVLDVDAKIAELVKQLTLLDDQITVLERQMIDATTDTAFNAAKTASTGLKTQRTGVSRQLVAAQLQSLDVKSQQNASAAAAVKAAADKVKALAELAARGVADDNKGLQYNASAVKEAYFSTASNFTSRVQGPVNIPTAGEGGTQPPKAADLWRSVNNSKGMIVTSEQVLKAWNSSTNKTSTSDSFDNHNYGFQFQYNPGTVAMSYYTSPNVDVTMITSGTEMFNLAGVSGSQGSVSFQVVINRILDMQYYTSDGALKDNVSGGDIYSIPPKTVEEYKALYDHGTMYDVEFLLRVLMGTTMNSYLRGERTADMGWLPAVPVELHLGKNLRYLGTVNNINLNHVIFDSRMVPVFTTVDIGFARLPDYPLTNTSENPFPSQGFRGV